MAGGLSSTGTGPVFQRTADSSRRLLTVIHLRDAGGVTVGAGGGDEQRRLPRPQATV